MALMAGCLKPMTTNIATATMKIDRYLIAGLFSMIFVAGMNGALAQSVVLSPSTLNRNPTLFNGKDVAVRGYVTLEPEGHLVVLMLDKTRPPSASVRVSGFRSSLLYR
jgi:hypothetical protein